MRRWLILPLLVSMAASAALPPAPPQFVPLTVADGLPSSVTYKTVQDRDGFIWIGTQDGLARYDSVGFRLYRHDPADAASLASNDVSALLVDRDGTLWAGGEGSGLNRLEADGTTFTRWMHRPNDLSTLGSNDLFTIEQDAAGAIWAGTYLGGLNRLEPDGSFLHIDHDAEDPRSLRSSTVYVLRGDARNRLWIGTDRGLDVREPDGRIVHVDLPLLDSRPGPSIVMAFLPDADGGMLVGTRKGLFRVGPDLRYREELAVATPPLPVSALARDEHGVWIGLLTGLARLDARGLQRYSAEEAAPGAYPGTRTMDILADAEGGVWFALFDGGVARLPPHWRNFAAFRHVPGDNASLTRARVKALGVEGSRAVWAASGNDGLDRIDRASGAIERWGERLHIAGQRLTAVLPEGDERVWVGFQTGLRMYSLRTLEAISLPVDLTRDDALPPGFVDALALAPDGSIWAAIPGGGVAHLAADPPRVLRRYMPSEDTLGDSDIAALVLDKDGDPWLATASGVERYDRARDRFVAVAGLPREAIHALAFAPDGRLWLHRVGALESWRIEPDNALLAQRFDRTDGWPTFGASALEIDAGGNAWVTSLRGLWKLDARARTIRRFDVRDGLPSQEFLPGALVAAADGTLFAGTLAGAVAFEPARLTLDTPAPSVRITALGVRRAGQVQQSLDAAAPIELRHDDLDLRVEVRALSYANPASNRYQFRLDGLENEWVDAAHGERIWSRLPPGDYRLQVRAANADGVWGAAVRPLPISVARAPWATPLAYALYALAVTLVLAWSMYAYRMRVRRRHAFALAEQQRRNSEQLVEAKSTFLATMGHEIRTPMTGVLGMSELLLGTPLDERQQGYAQAIQQSGQLLLRLVNDSLDIARIDAGKLGLDDRPFDPAALLREVALMQRPLAQRKGLALEVDVAANVPISIWGDEMRIKQILLNLVGNALKFTDHGRVDLALLLHGAGHLRFHVADTGPGMSAEVCARLFNRFEQAEGVLRRHGGSGLGLAICRELTLLMGGTITVSSTPGEGSVFDVDLPIYEAAGAREAAAVPAPVTEPVPDAVLDVLDVLVVEDDATVAEVIGGLLAQLGHRATHVSHGLAALAELENGRFDLALLDLDLPGIDGLQLARMLRTGNHAGLPLVAVTARSVGDEDAQIRAAGMDVLLRKPLTIALLRDAITAARTARTSAG